MQFEGNWLLHCSLSTLWGPFLTNQHTSLRDHSISWLFSGVKKTDCPITSLMHSVTFSFVKCKRINDVVILLSTKKFCRPVGIFSFPVDLVAHSFFPYSMTRQQQDKNPSQRLWWDVSKNYLWTRFTVGWIWLDRLLEFRLLQGTAFISWDIALCNPFL